MKRPVLFGSALFDELSAKARIAPRRRTHLNFHPSDGFPAHRLLVAMEPETYVRPHRHSAPQKDETLVALRGRFGLLLFSETGEITRQAILSPDGEFSGVDIPAGTFHSAIALEPGCVILESNAGPYEPATDKEWAPWAPPEDDPGGAAYLKEMRRYF